MGNTDCRSEEELVRQKGLEPLAHCLEGSCSIQLSYWREFVGAGDENRTRIPSLEGWCPDHCATPAYALRGNRQLGYINIYILECQPIFLHFFAAYRHLSRNARNSKLPSAVPFFAKLPRSRSGCHWTHHTGRNSCSMASTVPSGAHWTGRIRSPGRSTA